MLILRVVLTSSISLLLILIAGAVSAQDYPSKPIRIVTVAAGGGGDFTSRLIAQGIAPALGQPVIVDNRTSLLAAEFVSKAPPDGYTLLVTGSSVWVSPLLTKTPYDVVRDFLPISLVERTVMIVTVHPSLPVKSVKELIALARAKPGELNYGSATAGSTNHLAVELFKSMAGLKLVQVPFKGAAAAVTSLLGGEVDLVIVDSGLVLTHAKTGKLRALAVTSAEPSILAPGLPAVAATLPGYEALAMTGMWAPAKTPTAIINRLSQEIMRFAILPDVKERFLSAGVETMGSTPDQFAMTIRLDIARMTKVIRDAGIAVN